MPPAGELVRVRNLVKRYQALRPLRVAALDVRAGEIKTLVGLDAPAAEVMVGLVTGALLPDSGEVALFGRSTRAVGDSDAWLALLDGVGILTDRAVLIAQFSVEQNIAMPFTLAVDPIAADLLPRVHALAAEVGLAGDVLRTRVGDAAAEVAARVRLARALALDPSLLLAEHPTASVPRAAAAPLGRDIGRVARARGMAVLAISADPAFARALGGETLTHEAATGALRPGGLWRKLFGS